VFHQGLLTARELSSGEIFCLLLQRFHPSLTVPRYMNF
jgi:hypothetical protein